MFMTPAIVYRRSVALDLRFDTTLRIAGEDCLFFFELIGLCRRVCCSTRHLVTCADGINIHVSRYSWNDPGHLALYFGMAQAFCRIGERIPLSANNARFVAGRVKSLRRLFAFLTMRHFIKHSEPWPSELREMVRSDDGFLSWYLPSLAYVTFCYPLRLYSPLQDW